MTQETRQAANDIHNELIEAKELLDKIERAEFDGNALISFRVNPIIADHGWYTPKFRLTEEEFNIFIGLRKLKLVNQINELQQKFDAL